jgi:urease accessory protein
MVVITEAHLHLHPAELVGKTRDTLCLTWEERRWTRKRVVTSGGREIALALPTGSLLRPGEVIAVEDNWYLTVEGRPEPVLAVFPGSAREAIRVAFDVGNRHFPLALDGEALLVPDDSAMEQLLTRLSVRWERRQAVFDPIGQHHASGQSALDGHGHRHEAEGAPTHRHD